MLQNAVTGNPEAKRTLLISCFKNRGASRLPSKQPKRPSPDTEWAGYYAAVFIDTITPF